MATENLKEMLERRQSIRDEAAKLLGEINTRNTDPTDDENRKFDEWALQSTDLDRKISFRQKAEAIGGNVYTPQSPPATESRGNPGRDNTSHEPSREELDAETLANMDPEDRHAMNRRRIAGEIRNEGMKAFCLEVAGRELSEKQRTALKRCQYRDSSGKTGVNIPMFDGREMSAFKKGWRSEGNASGREMRALSNLNLAAGGAVVPEGFLNQLEIALLAYGGLRDVATVMRTDMGNPLPMPTVNDTTNKAVLLAENTAVSNQDIAFAQVVLSAYKFSSKQVLVPVELMQDSAFNLETYVGELLGIRMARGLNDYYTTGTGASQPNGLITAIGTNTVSAASSSGVAMDDVLALIHQVDPMYRPGASFMCHDSMKLALRKLKDGMGRYMWQDGDVQTGIPERLFGYPVQTNQSMQSVITSFSSGYKTLVFGEFKKFVIREVATIRMLVLRERYADADQVGFLAFMRADSNLLDAGTHPLKVLKH